MLNAQAEHIIHRVNLLIEAPTVAQAVDMEQQAVEVMKSIVMPQLQLLFDSWESDPKRHIVIPRIELNAGEFSGEEIHFHFPEKVLSLLTADIQKRFSGSVQNENDNLDNPNISGVVFYSYEKGVAKAMAHFLLNGTLPWWALNVSLEDNAVKDVIQHHTKIFRNEIIGVLKNSPVARERLTKQFSVDTMVSVIAAIHHGRLGEHGLLHLVELWQNALNMEIPAAISSTTILLEIVEHMVVQEFQSSVADVSKPEKLISEILKMALKEATRKTSIQSGVASQSKGQIQASIHPEKVQGGKSNPQVETHPGETEQQKFTVKNEEGILVKNAGLILLHPFLQYFFVEFNLLDRGKFRNGKSRELAIHLLHFVATGKDFRQEYELTMEKFLCDWPLEKPVNRNVKLNSKMKVEAKNLLEAAVEHWAAIGRVSPDALREGFLQRDGKIVEDFFQMRLIVENKTQDILLNKLPWSFSMINLPWREKMFEVEWKY